ncbi:LAFA_0G10660g1_1 [Lachancea sp. 'fantastica']|nr:LAFA_0G10660g1_1 [Lachancea sp. 'fantastica']
MSNSRPLAYTLRRHEHDVTALKIVSQDPFPVLISGDRSGLLLVWDLITRRPVATHKLESKAQIIHIDWVEKYVTVLSKDRCLRFFTLHDECDAALTTEAKRGSIANQKFSFEEVYSIPVNTLNFANVAIQTLSNGLFRLWCCNTQDPESFDVYTFDVKDQQSLKREFKAVNLYSILIGATNWDRTASLEKSGLVMSFLDVDGVVYVGFESGFVVGIRYIERNTAGPLLAMLHASSVHYPEPVLSLCSSGDGQRVYSSSTTRFVGEHGVDYNYKPESESNVYSNGISYSRGYSLCNSSIELGTAEIAHLESIQNSLVALNWRGQTVVANKQESRVVGTKLRSNLVVEASNVGSFSADKKAKIWVKASSIVCLGANTISTDKPLNTGCRKRVSQAATRNWTFTGYEDGSIVMQSFEL